VASLEDHWQPADAGEKAMKARWLKDYKAMKQDNLKLGVKQWDLWFRVAWDRRGHVLEKSDCIVSTCNNMAALIGKFGRFGARLMKEGLVIVDELALVKTTIWLFQCRSIPDSFG
jgi:hypothetical protein